MANTEQYCKGGGEENPEDWGSEVLGGWYSSGITDMGKSGHFSEPQFPPGFGLDKP